LLVFLALSSGMTFFLGRFFERDQADLAAFFHGILGYSLY